MSRPMPVWRRVAYALGNAGFLTADRLVAVLLLYFYLPPADSEMPAQVSQEILGAGLTAFGIAMILGRVIQSLIDPLVGYASDRSTARFGRRRTFMALGLLPMVVFPILGFFPPGAPGSWLNFWWLTGTSTGFFVGFTLYAGPYLALLPEIAWRQEDRVSLSTLIAVLALPAAIFGVAWTAALDLGRSWGLSDTAAIRWIVVWAALAALVQGLAPILAIDERRMARPAPAQMPLSDALRATLGNRPFLVFMAGSVFLMLGLNIVQPLLPYLAVVLGRSEGFGAVLGGALFGGTALGFAVTTPMTRRWGLRSTLVAYTLAFALGALALGLIQPGPEGGPQDARNLAVAFGALAVMGVPTAGFIVLPNVVLAQIIDYDASYTGSERGGIYFGMQGLLTKWVFGVSLAVLAFLFARYGNSLADPEGVIAAGPVAGVACLLAAACFFRYPEQQVLARIAAAAPNGTDHAAQAPTKENP